MKSLLFMLPHGPMLTARRAWPSPLITSNGGRAHYVMVSKNQWKPFWLATQPYPQSDWLGWQNGVNYDVCAQAPLDY